MISAERAAQNESTFREANEGLEQRADELGLADGGRIPFLCECDEERCTRVVLLTRPEYERVRAQPRAFVLSGGHEGAEDQVLRAEPGYTVVEKIGHTGELVEQRNPRS